MSVQQNKAIVNRFNEAFAAGNTEIMDELLAENVVNHAAPKGRPNGKESFRLFVENFRKGFPDFEMEILEQVAERDLVVTRSRVKAIHAGLFLGIAATGQSVEIEFIDIIRIVDGQYAEHWAQSNIGAVIQQLSAKAGIV